jgi:hypothetical protein
MRTSAYHRPAPSLFFFPGLSSQPFHKASNFAFTNDFKQNLSTLQQEYWALRKAYGSRDDYLKQDGEHTLNMGEWKWMNFIEKGEAVN